MDKENETGFMEVCPICGGDKFYLSQGVVFYYLTCDKCLFSKIFYKSSKTRKDTKKCNN